MRQSPGTSRSDFISSQRKWNLSSRIKGDSSEHIPSQGSILAKYEYNGYNMENDVIESVVQQMR